MKQKVKENKLNQTRPSISLEVCKSSFTEWDYAIAILHDWKCQTENESI